MVAMDDLLSIQGDLGGLKQVLTYQDGVLTWKEGENTRSWQEEELETVKLHHYVGSLTINAKLKDGQELVLLRGSQGLARQYQMFAQTINNRLQGKDDRAYAKEVADRCPKCQRYYADPARPICLRCLDRRSLSKRVLGLAPPYLRQIALMILLMLASSLVGLISPFLGGRIFFDEVLDSAGRYAGRIGQVVLAMFLAQLVTLFLSIWQGRVNSRVSARIVFDLKTQVFTAMQRLSLKFYNNQQTGSLMTRVNNDATHLQAFFHDGLPFFIVNSMRLVGIVAVLLAMDWQLALYVLIPVPLIVLGTAKLHPLLWRLYTRRFRALSRLNAVVNDSLGGVRVVKAFGTEHEEIQRFSRNNQRVFAVNREVGQMSSTVFPALSYLMSLGALVIWGVGGSRVLWGDLTFGTLITFTGYLGMLYGPLDFMTRIVDWWSSSMNSAQRIFEVIDSNELLWTPEPGEIVPMPRVKGSIAAQDVTFGYEEGKPVLEDISFTVEPGEMIGIVGRSGAGKSTLINLISRLYDPTAGIIFLDGVDLRYVDQKDLRRQVGMVLQDTFLFRGSVFENIAYGRTDASYEEVVQAARIANAHDFITKLPDGYETVLGQRNVDLSGGEKQRISIARVILHDPEILILDEATASIDTETEQLVQEALERLVRGRTTFAIAHRLSTLRQADRLFVLDRGKLVEVGSHQELLKKRGIYYKLFTTQRDALSHIGVAG